jgi:hypothetical protein
MAAFLCGWPHEKMKRIIAKYLLTDRINKYMQKSIQFGFARQAHKNNYFKTAHCRGKNGYQLPSFG